MPPRTLTLALLASTIVALASCRGACARTPTGASDDGGAAASALANFPPPLVVTTIAKANERFQGIALDDRYVYTGAMFHGSRRVPKAGGPLETVATSGDVGPSAPPDPRHAYFNGYGIEPSRTSEPGAESFVLGTDGVFARGVDGGMRKLARSLDSGAFRKALVVDDQDVYWIEPGADAVLAVPRHGGPVRWVCEAWVAVHYDLALAGDRLYLLDISGALTSVKKDGSDYRYLGTLSTDLGENRNGIWIATEGSTLYIVSDGAGTGGPAVIVIGEPMPTNTPDPVFDSRITKVDLAAATGMPYQPHDETMMMVGGAALSDLDANESTLEHAATELDRVTDVLRAGKVPITISLGKKATDAHVDASVAKVEAWLKNRYGANAKIVREPPGTGKDVATSIQIGVDRSNVATLFAP